MQQRVNGRLILLKEMMVLYMTSATDAFRMFSKNKKGFLTFKEFERLVYELSGYSQEKMPKPEYRVLKDLIESGFIKNINHLQIQFHRNRTSF